MKKELSTTKGNLIEMLIETEDGKAVLIHPFYLGATAIVFTDNWEFDDRYVGEYGRGQVIVLGSDGEVVGLFANPGEIKDIVNTVLYPNGKVWEGSVFSGLEVKAIQSVALDERGLEILGNTPDASFDGYERDQVPTIIVAYSTKFAAMCGWHHCNKCRYLGKFVDNSIKF